MSIKILDCTLRDGGYINDWNFTNHQIKRIIKSLKSSNVNIIECGYLNSKNGLETDSTLFNSISTVNNLLEPMEIEAQRVVMINLGDFDVNYLPLQKETSIDGIRLAFHKKDIKLALKISSKIIKLGYKLYFQPMVTKNYKDIEFLSLIDQVNSLDIYSFYIVDSFGSMTLEEFKRYLTLANNNLNSTISLGYHSHNNMQLAFSNAINMCNTNLSRDIIVDSSIYGIGRGAGNLNTELITDYLNDAYNKSYQTLPLLEIIDEFLSSLMREKPWGFSPAQYLSASFDCHPNYATYLINKNTNHIVGVRKVLENLLPKDKSSFNRELIENLYVESLLEIKTPLYGSIEIKDNKNILLIASGKSIENHKNRILKKVSNPNYITISLNHKGFFECDYYFFSNQKRFDEFKSELPMDKTIITSNIMSDVKVKSVLDFKILTFIGTTFVTNVAIVILNYIISKKFSKVEIAGLDGYQMGTNNYNYKETSVIVDDKELLEQNRILQESLESLKKQIEINFVTPSIFK